MQAISIYILVLNIVVGWCAGWAGSGAAPPQDGHGHHHTEKAGGQALVYSSLYQPHLWPSAILHAVISTLFGQAPKRSRFSQNFCQFIAPRPQAFKSVGMFMIYFFVSKAWMFEVFGFSNNVQLFIKTIFLNVTAKYS